MDKDAVPHEGYAAALLQELEFRASDLHGRRLSSVFFGGGTPSLWEPGALGRVLGRIKAAFDDHVDDLEVTVECNPSSLSAAHAARLREVGVNRLSIGVQSLRDDHLRFLGRLHDSQQAVDVVRDACIEIPRVSADLMFGMPGQEPEPFRDDIDKLLDLGVGHVSAYALTIEEKTLFGTLHKAGRLPLAPEEGYADMFTMAQAHFAERDWQQYEVSNYAPRGEESRHNQHYWRGGAYLGLGAAAVGCLDRDVGQAYRWRNEPIPKRYLEDPTTHRESEELGSEEIVGEAIMLGLRTVDGVDLEATGKRAGVDVRHGRAGSIERAVARGDLIDEGHRLRVPASRWLKLDGIVRDLF